MGVCVYVTAWIFDVVLNIWSLSISCCVVFKKPPGFEWGQNYRDFGDLKEPGSLTQTSNIEAVEAESALWVLCGFCLRVKLI